MAPAPVRTSVLLLAVLGAGCDRLGVAPGHDFGVAVLTPSPIPAIGKITVPIRVAVTGCDAFDPAVHGGGGASHPIALAPQGDGTFLAQVPVEWLRGEDGSCVHDARAPLESHAQLLVTCRDAGRTATADLAISYGTATRADLVRTGLPQAEILSLVASRDPFVPYALAPSNLEPWAELYPPWFLAVPFSIDGPASLVDPLVRPRLAANDSSVFVASGCLPGVTCPVLSLSATATAPGEALFGQVVDAQGYPGSHWWPVWVPAQVIDMAFLADGTLVVLSMLQRGASWPDGTTVTRVVPTPGGGTADVSVIGYFPRERPVTRFSATPGGQLAFVSLVEPTLDGPIQSVLHETDGVSVASSPDPTGGLDVGQVAAGGGRIWYRRVQLAPDASALVVEGSYFVVPGSSADALPSGSINSMDGDRGGAAWPTGAVALWKGESLWLGFPPAVDTGGVEAFALAPPHARLYGYEVHPLPGSSGPVGLHGATAVGDRLVLTTSTGVRILGPDGTVVGGSDPLPCGLSPTAVAVQTGPTTAAVAAGDYLYVFDVSG